MTRYFFFVLLVIIYHFTPFTICEAGAEKYLTIEERNAKALEEAIKLHEERSRYSMEKEKREIEKPEDIDFSKYHHYIDFQNVFTGVNSRYEWDWLAKPDTSIWHAREENKVRALLSKEKVDWIVLPVEDFTAKNDSISRNMAAEFLAAGLENRAGLSCLPIEPLLDFLGKRSFFFNKVYELHKLGLEPAPKVVHLLLKKEHEWYAKKNPEMQYRLAVVVTRKGMVEKYAFFSLPKMTDEKTLEVLIREKNEEILGVLLDGPPPAAKKTATFQDENMQLPADIGKGMAHLSSPLEHAAWLQFFALLTPELSEQKRDRLFERSLVALTSADPESVYSKIFSARALTYLHRRPQALEFLDESSQPEMRAVAAYINGNYFALRDNLERIQSPVLHIVSYFELLELAGAYGKPLPELSIDVPVHWQAIIQYGTDLRNPWKEFDTTALLTAFSELFPQLNGLIKDEVAAVPDDRNGMNFGNAENDFLLGLLGRIEKAQGAAGAPMSSALAGGDDFLALFHDILVSIPLKQLSKKVELQGAYTSAVRLGDYLVPLYSGQSVFESLYADALYHYALQVNPLYKDYYYEKADRLLCRISTRLYPYEKVLQSTKFVRFRLYEVLRDEADACQHGGMGWIPQFYPSDQDNERYTITGFSYLATAFEKKRISEQEFWEQVAQRFDGSPQAVVYKAKMAADDGDRQQAIEMLSSALTDDSGWEVYHRLGQYLIQEKEFSRAEQVFLSFPDFYDPPSGRVVQTSNYLYGIGNMFEAADQRDTAAKFYSMCLSFGTGSGREMRSAYKLALRKKAYYQAARQAYREYARYDSISGLSLYLQTMSMLGDNEMVMRKIPEVMEKYKAARDTWPLWEALLVESRTHLPQKEIGELLAMVMPANPSKYLLFGKKRFGFVQGSVDRKLSQRAVPVMYDRQDAVSPGGSPPKGIMEEIFGTPSGCRDEASCSSSMTELTGVQGVDRYVFPYMGLWYLQQGEATKARDVFLYFYRRYPLHTSYFVTKVAHLPYALMALDQSGDLQPEKLGPLEDFLTSGKEKRDDYMAQLALAVIAAEKGGHTEAMKYLRRAYEIKMTPFSDDPFIIPVYQLVVTAEWMFHRFGKKEYLESAMSWAVSYRYRFPQVAWPYAFAALYGEEADQRIEDAAYAIYLDRKSLWLSRLDKDLRAKADDWLKSHELFQDGEASVEDEPSPKAQKKAI